MKKLSAFVFFTASLIAVQSTTAQTVDEIIAKHLTALGGKEKLLSINTIKMLGSMNIQGTDVSLTLTKQNNVGSRTDIEVMGTSNYQIVTAAKGTVFMPVQGMTDPQTMPADQLKVGQTQLDLQSPFINYKEKGSTVELDGTEKMGDEENYKLKVTYKNGLVTTFFIGAKNNMLNKSRGKRTINGETKDMETTYSDYKKNADGFMFAYAISGPTGDITFDKIETNIKVDPSIFN